ncbi:unnamed protein product [Cercospora beticola]|nr:unnamed protein product [Cercospora beticola]
MQSIRQIERLNQTELDKCIPPNASWHTDYRDTAYLYIGGLPFELSEGDILTIFSQYGNPVHINLVRDKDTGKSRGFCFLKYEDQRSCDLAVDNLSGAGVMGRVISVDHTRYKKKEGEVEGIGDEDVEDADDTDREGDDRRKRRKTEESESEEERPLIKEEIELQKLLREHDDDDPMKEYLVQAKREEVAEALKAVVKQKGENRGHDRHRKHSRHHHHRSSRRGDESDDGDRERRRHEHRSRRDRQRDSNRSRHESPPRDESSTHSRSRRHADRDALRRSTGDDSLSDADSRRRRRRDASRDRRGKERSP